MSGTFLIAYALMLIFDGFVIGGTAYIVFWLGFSGWWFLLAFIFVGANAPSFKTTKTQGSSNE